jgi:hypothetical protein
MFVVVSALAQREPILTRIRVLHPEGIKRHVDARGLAALHLDRVVEVVDASTLDVPKLAAV